MAAFRLTAWRAKERVEHRVLADALRVLIGPPGAMGYGGAVWLTIDHGVSTSDGERIDAWNRGVVRGVPDLLFLYRGVTHWIELKRVGEKARASQRTLHECLALNGHCVAVCEGADAAIAQLEAWGIPLRGRVAA